MSPTMTLLLLILAMLAAGVYGSYLMARRAVRIVVMTFRDRGATSPKNALTIEQLGLTPYGFVERMTRPRDYRPYALQLLRQEGIVRDVGGGRLYLSESELARSRVKELSHID